MKRILLACLIACLFMSGTQAQTTKVLGKKVTAAGGGGDLLSETFGTGADGYTKSWTETNGTRVDPDQTAGCASGTGWAGDCLKVDTELFASTNAGHDLLSGATTSYHRFYLYWPSSGLNNDQYNVVYAGVANGGTVGSCDPFCVKTIEDSSGNQQLRLLIAGINTDITGTLTLPYQKRIEIKWVNNGASDSWEWRIDGVTEGSGSGDLSANNVQDIYIGSYDEYANIFYVDKVDVSSTTWPGE